MKVTPRPDRIALILGLLTLAYYSPCLGQTQTTPITGIEGVITIGPIHGGPARDGVPHTRPLGGTTFIVEGESSVVTSFTTDEEGRFRVSLPPGHYTVTKKEREKSGTYGPFSVDVIAGKLTNVAWNCDDGRM